MNPNQEMAFLPPYLIFFFIVSFLLPQSIDAQSNGNVSIGAFLDAKENSSWSSPSGDFSFGFRQIGNNNLFLPSIWYSKVPERTIIWYANGDTPATSGSRVELTSDHGLVLTDPQNQELWKSGAGNNVVSHAFLNDTGNFVVFDSNSRKLWDSFSNPTDTILPTQTIERGYVISSRRSETNFSKGKFQVDFLQNGNLVLNSINLPSNYTNEPYFLTNTAGSNSSSPANQLFFNESGYIYMIRENGQRVDLTPARRETVSSTEFYYRATLDFDGVFTLYYHPKNSDNNGNWTAVWFIPDNICGRTVVTKSSGVCGYNSICSIDPDGRPICSCPKGYSLLDPSDNYGSCKANFIPSCEKDDEISPDLYTFEEMLNVDWTLADYAAYINFTEDQCKTSCLEDCMCAVAIFRLGNACWKKKLPLSNGRADNGLFGKAFIKVRKDNTSGNDNFPVSKDGRNNKDVLLISGAVLLGFSVFANLLLIGFICLGFFLIYKKKEKNGRDNGSASLETNLRCFSYKELSEATNGFKEELGRGAFGVVYKGELRKRTSRVQLIAVKKLNTTIQDGDKEFRTEVNVIGQTHHKNLVRLLGFCDEGIERLLVYEYLSNGTLASFLFGELKPSWKQRTQIASGISRGLLYLHEECSTQIIHCDIKPQNILLDDYYNARISDFGLAKLLMMNQSHTHTAIRGTKGYVAPEWFRHIPVTVKVDVYSFGVMLLEIICCRRCVEMEMENEEKAILTDWAYDCFREGTLDSLVRFDMESLDHDWKTLERFVKVAIWCIQEDPSLRPTMRKVVPMLEGVLEVPVPPSPFSLSIS